MRDTTNQVRLRKLDKYPEQNAFPLTISIDRANYYEYLRWYKKLKKGVLSRVANQAWSRFFSDFQAEQIKALKEQGISNIESISAAASKSEIDMINMPEPEPDEVEPDDDPQ